MLVIVLAGVALLAPKDSATPSAPAAPSNPACRTEVGLIVCDIFGGRNVQSAENNAGIPRVVYKWTIFSDPVAELPTQNRRIVQAICALRAAGFDDGNYRFQAMIDVVDASGNTSEEGGIGVTIEQAAIQGINCDNPGAVNLEAIAYDYFLNSVIR